MTFSVFESLKDVAAEWDALLPANHHLESRQLIILEKAGIKDIQFRYLFIYKDNLTSPVAVAYLQLVQFHAIHYQSPLFKNFLLRAVEKKIMKRGFQLAIAGNLFRIDSPGIFFSQPELISSIQLMQVMERYFKTLPRQPHAIMIKDWQIEWDSSWVKAINYHLWPDDLTMKMNIDKSWKTFEDYTGSLKHKYAQRARKARKKLQGVTCIELSLEEIIRNGAEIEMLYREVVDKQVIKMVIPGKNYFIEMKRSLDNEFKIFGYFTNGELIAFSSHIITGELWEMHYIGMNYEQNEKHWLYFNMMFDALERAIQMEMGELELGRTARKAKAMLGGLPVYFTSYIHLKGAAVNLLVRLFAKRFNNKAGEDWQIRHPYKSDQSIGVDSRD